MKEQQIKLPISVRESFARFFDRIPENVHQDDDTQHPTVEPSIPDSGELGYPVFMAKSSALKNKKLEVESPSWLLFDPAKKVCSEFDRHGELEKLYPANASTREMQDLLESSEFASKKTKAILVLTALNLRFCWFGDTIPEAGSLDKFVLFGYTIPGFEKGKAYDLEGFMENVALALKKLADTIPNSIGGV